MAICAVLQTVIVILVLPCRIVDGKRVGASRIDGLQETAVVMVSPEKDAVTDKATDSPDCSALENKSFDLLILACEFWPATLWGAFPIDVIDYIEEIFKPNGVYDQVKEHLRQVRSHFCRKLWHDRPRMEPMSVECSKKGTREKGSVSEEPRKVEDGYYVCDRDCVSACHQDSVVSEHNDTCLCRAENVVGGLIPEVHVEDYYQSTYEIAEMSGCKYLHRFRCYDECPIGSQSDSVFWAFVRKPQCTSACHKTDKTADCGAWCANSVEACDQFHNVTGSSVISFMAKFSVKPQVLMEAYTLARTVVGKIGKMVQEVWASDSKVRKRVSGRPPVQQYLALTMMTLLKLLNEFGMSGIRKQLHIFQEFYQMMIDVALAVYDSSPHQGIVKFFRDAYEKPRDAITKIADVFVKHGPKGIQAVLTFAAPLLSPICKHAGKAEVEEKVTIDKEGIA